MMCVLAPVMKRQTLARRWSSQHIPVVVVVDSEDSDDVLEQVQRVLATGGWRTDRRLASWMARLPTRVLKRTGGDAHLPATPASRVLFLSEFMGSVIGFDHFSRPHLRAGVGNFGMMERP